MVRKVRIWVDGCFDTMHYGHSNALRQAKEMGDVLVVGVHSDTEIEANKGPTVLKNEERYKAVRACKWVDEVVEDAPYLTSLDYLNQYECDFCVHGDDVTTMSDGTDCYALVKDAGRYRECKRTKGVSTTDLVKRMLARKQNPRGEKAVCDESYTKERIELFDDHKEPKRGDCIVYVDGSFDMFHHGHPEFLEKAKEHGDYLIVGVHDDDIVADTLGAYPILNMYERTLSLLACRYVDKVIMEAPLFIDDEFLKKHNIDLVINPIETNKQFYQVPILNQKYKFLPNQTENVSCESIINRILENYETYTERNKKKEAKSVLEAQLKSQ